MLLKVIIGCYFDKKLNTDMQAVNQALLLDLCDIPQCEWCESLEWDRC